MTLAGLNRGHGIGGFLCLGKRSSLRIALRASFSPRSGVTG